MTDLLTKTIMDGHRGEIMTQIVEKLIQSEEYEEYIIDSIENVLSSLLKTEDTDDD